MLTPESPERWSLCRSVRGFLDYMNWSGTTSSVWVAPIFLVEILDGIKQESELSTSKINSLMVLHHICKCSVSITCQGDILIMDCFLKLQAKTNSSTLNLLFHDVFTIATGKIVRQSVYPFLELLWALSFLKNKLMNPIHDDGSSWPN